MSVPGILRKVDAITVRVPDIDADIHFYMDLLGHRVKWRKGPGQDQADSQSLY